MNYLSMTPRENQQMIILQMKIKHVQEEYLKIKIVILAALDLSVDVVNVIN